MQLNEAATTPLIENLATLDEEYTVNGEITIHHFDDSNLDQTEAWSSTFTWGELFGEIAPYLIDQSTNNDVRDLITQCLHPHHWQVTCFIDNQHFQTIKMQFQALRLVEVTEGVWSLTPSGQALAFQLRTVKSQTENQK